MIVVRLMGGLGNQMFQYAFGLYLANTNNTKLKLDLTLLEDRNSKNANVVYRDFELSCFKLSGQIASQKEIHQFNPLPTKNIFKKIRNKLYYFYHKNIIIQNKHDWNSSNLKIKNNTCIVGRWQSELYFKNIEDAIRKEFIFKNELNEYSKDIANQIQRNNKSISIHLRRIDYVNNKLYAEKIGALKINYYNKAIKKICELIERPRFFIFSDDIEFAKKNLPKNINAFFIKQKSNVKAEQDLHLISLCKNHIISNSTFSWWGAWLSNNLQKIVIAPKNWAKDVDYKPNKIIPNNWIKI